LLVVLSVVHNLTPIGLVRLSGGSARVMLLPFLLPLALLALPALSYWGPEQWAPMEVDWLGRHLPLALPGLLSALVLAQCLHYLAVLRILPDGPWLMSDRDCRWADQEYLQRENGTSAANPAMSCYASLITRCPMTFSARSRPILDLASIRGDLSRR